MTKLLATALDLVTGVSTVLGLALAVRGARSASAPTSRAPGPVLALLVHPLGQWAIVWLLLLANQIAFDAYVLRVHRGDPSFVAGALGVTGWFQLALDWPVVRALANVGDGRWLAPSVLRVQAFLELPVTLYAYLAVARLLGRDVVRDLTRPATLFAASFSFSATFSLVELALTNPYTRDDLVLRALAAVIVPFWVMATSRRDLATAAPGTDGRPRGALGHLAFLVGAVAVAVALLAAYDAFLLYNLGHLGALAPVLVVAWPWAIVASWLAPRIGSAKDEGVTALLREAAAGFAVAFFVPSLAIRYAATHPIAPLAGAATVLAGIVLGGARYARARASAPEALVPALATGTLAGLAASALVSATGGPLARPGELLLAAVAAAFLGTFVVASRLVERVLARRGA